MLALANAARGGHISATQEYAEARVRAWRATPARKKELVPYFFFY